MEDKITITKEELIPFIEHEGCEMGDMLLEAEKKYGSRYNHKNIYAEARRRFGDPKYCAKDYAEEYLLIERKQSEQPSNVRKVIVEIVSRAINKCFAAKIEAIKKAAKMEQLETENDNINN